uniref:Defective in cullin neddylation protein n=1 Tax=Rhodosorus marinus TaxID=101924 RepID=A0A7S0BN34_9RHOD|mmetsp:Transcript_2308/g.3410  ORF Transcript_2308/g.3410 Transcript_2308/m.3410 type:complete len:201 (+) Transcript_2308:236-838(+)
MPGYREKDATSLFNKYKEEDEDKIGLNGLERLYGDLGISLDDIVTLLFAWRLDASTLCEITKDEFLSGLRRMRVCDIRSLKSSIENLRPQIYDQKNFRDFYLWCFDYFRDSRYKTMDLETAKAVWAQLLKEQYTHLDLWLEFIEANARAISRDTYSLFLNFIWSVADDFSGYDDTAAWPVLIDEFVEYAKGKLAEREEQI